MTGKTASDLSYADAIWKSADALRQFDCIVAKPAQLFFTTGIHVCLWFLTRDKTQPPRRLQGGIAL